MFPSVFETDRLRFERLCEEYVPVREYYEFCTTDRPGIAEETAYVPWSPVESMGDAAARLGEFEEAWENHERAEWVVRPKQGESGAGEVVGRTGLICRWDRDLVVPAIWLRESAWGKGYSGERADAVLRIGFERLDVGVAAILIHAENTQSYQAVSKYVERHGGRYEGILRNHGGRYEEPVDHHRFTISQTEYERANGTQTSISLPET